MADISITAANVIAASGADIGRGPAGATITAGQPVYVDASDSNKIKLADNNASSSTADAVGVSLHGASSGQPIAYIKSGGLTAGATLVAGQTYITSTTAGGIKLIADQGTAGSGEYPVIVGMAYTTAAMTVLMAKPSPLTPL